MFRLSLRISETFESRQRERNTTRSDRPISSEGLVPAPISSPENSHRIQRAWLKCARHAKGCLLTCSTDASVKAPLIIGTSVAPPAKCRNPPWGPGQGRPPTSQATPRAEGGMPASRGPAPPPRHSTVLISGQPRPARLRTQTCADSCTTVGRSQRGNAINWARLGRQVGSSPGVAPKIPRSATSANQRLGCGDQFPHPFPPR